MAAVGVMVAHASRNAEAQDESTEGLAGGQMVRGIVTTTAANRLAIKTDKGDTYQITVTDNTRIVKDRQPFKLTAVRAGDTVGAMGVLDAPTRTVHALFVMVVDAEEVKKAREGLGKVYIAGKVTAIDELKLTVQRPDGVSQVIAVDEGTSFRKGGRQLQSAIDGTGPSEVVPGGAPGGESITLADIKVGDNVAGKGELRGGIFVPSQLGVGDPSTRRRRRSEGAGSAGAPGPQ
ncbi:hypothetical protein [Granulicella arctica]|uniref:hypothetical protein n=1 Tax=Granulicella arctica TaxID=940613 RepID=UPI0021E02058|nr:hypothetical protein [Granulicella arctica]